MKIITILFLSFIICAYSFGVQQVLELDQSEISVAEIYYASEMSVDEAAIPPNWFVVVQIELKRGTQVEINGQAVVLDRLREYYTMRLSVEDMQDLLGENYGAVLFAVENGDYSPDGEVAAALIAQAALRLGASGE